MACFKYRAEPAAELAAEHHDGEWRGDSPRHPERRGRSRAALVTRVGRRAAVERTLGRCPPSACACELCVAAVGVGLRVTVSCVSAAPVSVSGCGAPFTSSRARATARSSSQLLLPLFIVPASAATVHRAGVDYASDHAAAAAPVHQRPHAGDDLELADHRDVALLLLRSHVHDEAAVREKHVLALA